MARTRKTEEERRIQIKNAAKKLFRTKGFENVSTKEIAIESGLSRALVYRYGASKTEILEDIFRDMIQDQANLLRNMKKPQGTATKRIMAFLATLFESDFSDYELRRLAVQHSWTWSLEREIEFFVLVGRILDPISESLFELGINQKISDRIAIWAIYTEGLRQSINHSAAEKSIDRALLAQKAIAVFIGLVEPQIDRLLFYPQKNHGPAAT